MDHDKVIADYDIIVTNVAKSKLGSIPVALSPEFLEYISTPERYEKFFKDIDNKFEELKAKSIEHKNNNTPEYQNALLEYNKLREKYSEILAEKNILIGISTDDFVLLDNLKQYGVDVSLKDFLEDVQKNTTPIKKSKEELEEQKRNIEKMMEFDEKFKYDIPEENRVFGK